MSGAKVLRIGIASRERMTARTLAIARGGHKPATDEPNVWFTSMESLAQSLSSKNTLLLEMIRRARPASLEELTELSGRQVSNLSHAAHHGALQAGDAGGVGGRHAGADRAL